MLDALFSNRCYCWASLTNAVIPTRPETATLRPVHAVVVGVVVVDAMVVAVIIIIIVVVVVVLGGGGGGSTSGSWSQPW